MPKNRVKISVVLLVMLIMVVAANAQTPARQVPVDSLIFDLKNPDPVRRKEAAKLLGDNKVKKATPDLVAAAGDADPAVRREIVIALDKMLDINALPGFVKMSADSEKDIRDRCIVGLINLYIPQESGLVVSLNKVANFFNPWSDEWGEVLIEPGIKVEPSVVAALCERLKDTDDGIRLKAARALGILKAQAAVPTLAGALRQDQSYAMRFEIIRSLRKIGDPSVAPDLKAYLTYNDAKVRNEAVFAVGRFHYREASPYLISLFEKERSLLPKLVDKTYCEFLLDAIAFIADPGARELLLKEKQNPEDNLRLYATEGLARLGDPSLATDTSRAWLREPNPKVKTAQAYALFRMGRREFLDELVNCLGSGKTNVEARKLLLELKKEDLAELYSQAKNNDVNVREGLTEILGLIGDERAIPIVQNLAQDRRGQIAALANQANRRLNARIVQ
jgi:HEAT repeat protein